MKNKTCFHQSTLVAFTCLTLFGFACTKSDSLGEVGGKDAGADGTAKDGNGCQATNGNPSGCDAPPTPDTFPGPDTSSTPDLPLGSGCNYPAEAHVKATGETVWSWRFHWQEVNLAETCAAWGADAKVILEAGVPANPSGSGTTLPTCAADTISTGAGPRCAMANAWRFEAVCTDAQLLAELPSINTFHGYYHVESSAYPNSPRHLISQDPHCSRDLYLPTGIGSPPATKNDGSVDRAPDGGTTATPDTGVNTAPDGGTAVTPDTGAESGTGCACVLPAPMTWSTTTWDCYCSVHDCTVNQAAFTASFSGYGWSTDDYANCDLRVLSFKFSTGTDMASRRIFQLSSGKMVGSFDTADTGVRCPFEAPDANRLLGLLAGAQIDASCVRSASSCPDAGATSCFR